MSPPPSSPTNHHQPDHQQSASSQVYITSTASDLASSPRKRVRIQAEGRVVAEVATLSIQERSETWWSAGEFAAVKDSVKRQCRSYRRKRRYSDCLTNAYNTACEQAAQEQLISETDHDSSVQQPPDKGLLRWLEDQGPRGLEGYSSRLHALRRQRHLQESKHAVFMEQARQIISNERNDELLARQAEQASRRARNFATLLGHADAWAANNSLLDPVSENADQKKSNELESSTDRANGFVDDRRKPAPEPIVHKTIGST